MKEIHYRKYYQFIILSLHIVSFPD